MAFTGWMVRLKSYGEIAANRLTQSGTVAVAQVGLGVAGTGAGGLLFGTVVGSLAGSSRLFRAAWRASGVVPDGHARGRPGGGDPIPPLPRSTRHRRSRSTSLVSLPLLWMVAVYGTDAGGQFAARPAHRRAARRGGGRCRRPGLLRRGAPAVHDGTPGLRALFLKTTRSLALTAIGPFTLGALLRRSCSGSSSARPGRKPASTSRSSRRCTSSSSKTTIVRNGCRTLQPMPRTVCLYRTFTSRQTRKDSSSRDCHTSPSVKNTARASGRM